VAATNSTNQTNKHRHLSNIDCLKARTACLVCFISTVNGHCKKKKPCKTGTSSGHILDFQYLCKQGRRYMSLISLSFLDVYGANQIFPHSAQSPPPHPSTSLLRVYKDFSVNVPFPFVPKLILSCVCDHQEEAWHRSHGWEWHQSHWRACVHR
jgi:hypothetical protein